MYFPKIRKDFSLSGFFLLFIMNNEYNEYYYMVPLGFSSNLLDISQDTYYNYLANNSQLL